MVRVKTSKAKAEGAGDSYKGWGQWGRHKEKSEVVRRARTRTLELRSGWQEASSQQW